MRPETMNHDGAATADLASGRVRTTLGVMVSMGIRPSAGSR
jgi:hypothetical protein